MKLSDSVYTFLKWFTCICLPALGTLYFAVAGIWGLPYAEQIVGTISAITTFLGIILGISTANYNKQKAFEATLDAQIEAFKGEEEDK